MNIRSVNIADKPAWLAVQRRLMPGLDDQEHERNWNRMMEQRGHRATLVCLDDSGALLGLIVVARRADAPEIESGPVGWVETLHVEPGETRDACARQLADAAARWAQTRGCRALVSDTSLDNQWEQKLHRELGFDEVARKVIYRRVLQARAAAPVEGDAPVARPMVGADVDAARRAGEGEDAIDRSAWWPGPVRAGVIVLGLVCLYFTDLFSGSIFFGVVLPMIDVVFIVYLMVLFVDMKYRRKTGAEGRQLELLHGSNDGGDRPS